jgi:hypothetical protein
MSLIEKTNLIDDAGDLTLVHISVEAIPITKRLLQGSPDKMSIFDPTLSHYSPRIRNLIISLYSPSTSLQPNRRILPF